MRQLKRLAALGGAAALVKAGEAFGLASGVGLGSAAVAHGATCGTNAFVKFSVPMQVDPPTPGVPNYGTASLWYSATCRTVAAQVGVPSPVQVFPLTSADLSKLGRDGTTAACAVDPGAQTCKTDFVDDAGIQQRARGLAYDGSHSYVGVTQYW
jgi:hypothetical protein